MPFVTFYTPTYARPGLLYNCERSVRAQTDQDLQHLVIEDTVGIGIDGMYRQVQEHAGRVRGNYVYMLQDDDVLSDAEVVADFKAFVGRRWPEVVICQILIGKRALPPETAWGVAPRLGKIDLGCYFVRADVWKRHARDFGPRYEGDYDFIAALWREGYRFDWWERIVAVKQAIGSGRPEPEVRLIA